MQQLDLIQKVWNAVLGWRKKAPIRQGDYDTFDISHITELICDEYKTVEPLVPEEIDRGIRGLAEVVPQFIAVNHKNSRTEVRVSKDLRVMAAARSHLADVASVGG